MISIEKCDQGEIKNMLMQGSCLELVLDLMCIINTVYEGIQESSQEEANEFRDKIVISVTSPLSPIWSESGGRNG